LLLAIEKPRQDARAQTPQSVFWRLNLKWLRNLLQTAFHLTLARPLLARKKFAAVVLKLVWMLLKVRVVFEVADLLCVVKLQQALLKQRTVVIIQIKLLYQARLIRMAIKVAFAEAGSKGLVVAHS
jgi:hypothetical protein